MAGRRRRSPRSTCPDRGTPTWRGRRSTSLTDVRDVLERASARETAARVAGGAVLQGVPARARRRDRLPRRPDRHRPRPRRTTSRWRSSSFAAVDESPVRCLDARRFEADGRPHQRPAQGQRVARRRVRGPRLRADSGPWLARLLGGAPRRPAGRGACARSRRSRASASGKGFDLAGKPGSQAHDEIFHTGGARLLPGDQPRRRARGRDDDRRAADRPGGDEAAADADQAAALGRHRHARAGAALRERTDSCTVPAAGVVGEAMVAYVLACRLPREARRRPHRRRARGPVAYRERIGG